MRISSGPARAMAPAKPVMAVVNAARPAPVDPGQTPLQRLSAGDRAAYMQLWNQAGPDDRDRLQRLLTAGLGAQKDALGGSLFADLATVLTLRPPANAPYKAKDVLTELLTHLDTPQTLHQDSRNTCAATTTAYLLLATQPAEYVRLAAGLMGQGRVDMQHGGTLTRVADSVSADDTDRDDVMRIMQAAFMDEGGDARGSYSNVTDTFTRGSKLLAPLNGLLAKLQANFGIGESSVKQLFQDVLGLDADTAGDVGSTDFLLPASRRKGVYDQVAAAVKAGRPVAVDILTQDLQDAPGRQQEHGLTPGKLSYADQMRSHQILVTGIDEGGVRYRNPWGYETVMSVAEFKSRLTDAVIASSAMPRVLPGT